MPKLEKQMQYLHKSISLKRYITLLLIVIGIFLFYHAVIWHRYTSKLLDIQKPNHIGDLARIGYQLSSIHSRIQSETLPKKHLEFSQWKGENIDILTIGDSFSNGGGGGENPYYQDFIASDCNLTVMNINPSLFGENYLKATAALLSSGLLEKINPKAVLIESVERYTLGRFSKPIQWDQNFSQEQLFNDLKKGQWGDGKPPKEDISFISIANYKLPLYNLYYQFTPNAFGYSNTYKLSLSKPMFTVKAASTLLIFEHDITSLGGVTREGVTSMNDNFNHLASLLASKNIQLIYMIAVDKYDLYEPYIARNPYGENPLFDLLRPMKKNYIFIDTKAILSQHIDKGEKNIFYSDDTHWSNKASEKIANDPIFIFLQNKTMFSHDSK